MTVRALPKQCIERSEKCRQRFAGAGRCGNQYMPSGLNGRPAGHLGFGRRTERLFEPPRDRRMKSEGLHERESAKCGTTNLDRVSRKKSCGEFCSRFSMRRAACIFEKRKAVRFALLGRAAESESATGEGVARSLRATSASCR